ncbi:protein FAR1-RELATED SEQUENCE 5-like [Helianthus annuus]|uniref:protein FAR1-RELATED SEQUENCE 5-like n=1 Tax=Helianthus annuus TaxID=4232 RepID=UPI001652FF17|nr:protein FAR1-RELATED SEQUENCE 5-like [Helianthus annuus]
MEGHPYAKRLFEDEFNLVAELTRMNVAPRDILAIIKERNLSNVSTLRTIYNARNKIRMVDQIGKSPMQVLLSLLHSNGYVYEITTTGLNELENLFFIHPTSFDIWRAFPHVLIIDVTYKTNHYNMPFLEVVGVTSTSKTFSIAFAFMHNEKIVNYTWVLNCLKLTLDQCMLPRVIVTDREMALMNACKEVFRDAAHLFCRWHIEQNLFRRCRQSFRSVKAWEEFLLLWKSLENSTTLESYTENYRQLETLLIKHPRVLAYVNESWLNDYKERFVSVWIDQHLNFGNNTTNRVESQHAKLKKYLDGSNSSLDRFLRCIDRIVTSQQITIKESLENQYVSLDSIDIFWKKLDISPLVSFQNDDVSYDDELLLFKEYFKKQSKDGQKSWLRKLKDILFPGKTDIQEPQVQKKKKLVDDQA